MKAYRTNRLAVRRFLLDSQQLLNPSDEEEGRPAMKAALAMIRQLECVQIDPVAAVERNQHLVLAARLPHYKPEFLNELLYQGHLFEYWANAACTIPMEDYPIFEPTRKRRKERLKTEMEKYKHAVEAVLERLEAEGPLPSRAFRSDERVHGYWDNKLPKTKVTSLALNLLLDSGTIRVVSREGSERFFHLTLRTVQQQLLQRAEAINLDEGNEALLEKYLRAYRVFDHNDPRLGWQRMSAAERRAAIMRRVENETVVPLDIDGVRTHYYVLAEDLDKLRSYETNEDRHPLSPEEGPVRFLPPLDNLLWRRERIADLFGFNYKWEIYTPKEKRVYGYYAMPILAGDQLIGRIDPGLDRETGQLNIRLLQIEPGVQLTEKLRQSLREALETFAEFHQATNIVIQRTDPLGLSV